MAIQAYTGLMGSGKTYSAVANQILPAIRQGITVVTNLPLKLDLLRADFPGCDVRDFPLDVIKAEPDRIFEFCPKGCLVLIDEALKLWPSGQTAKQVPDAFKSFLTEHRHMVDAGGRSMSIVLVCQDLAQIASVARNLVETTFRSVKLTNVGLKSRFRVDVYNGPMSGPNPPQSQRLREMFYKYDSKVYRYYNSHTQSDSGREGADESTVDRRNNLLLKPLVLTAPFAIVLLVWFGIHQLDRPSLGLARADAAGQRSGSGAPGSGPEKPAGIVASVGAAVKAEVSPWRLSIVIRGLQAGDVAMLEDGQHSVFVDLRRCRKERWDLYCPYAGRYWDSQGLSEPERQAPL